MNIDFPDYYIDQKKIVTFKLIGCGGSWAKYYIKFKDGKRAVITQPVLTQSERQQQKISVVSLEQFLYLDDPMSGAFVSNGVPTSEENNIAKEESIEENEEENKEEVVNIVAESEEETEVSPLTKKLNIIDLILKIVSLVFTTFVNILTIALHFGLGDYFEMFFYDSGSERFFAWTIAITLLAATAINLINMIPSLKTKINNSTKIIMYSGLFILTLVNLIMYRICADEPYVLLIVFMILILLITAGIIGFIIYRMIKKE